MLVITLIRGINMKNVGGIDRILRIVIGAAVLGYAAYLWKTTGVQPSPWYLLGAVPLLTGLIGWCPPYSLLGMSSCSTKK